MPKVQLFKKRSRRFLLRFITVVLVSALSLLSVSQLTTEMAWGQTPIPLATPGQSLNSAPVRLNGLPVFEVASPPVEEGADSSIPPIERRVQEIERTLRSIMEDSFNPDSLEVYYEILNNQPIIMVEDREDLSPRVVLTVTEVDAELADTTPEQLAETWTEQLQEALLQAREERQPEVRDQRIRIAIAIAVGVFVLSPIVFIIQRRLDRRYQELSRQRHPEDLQTAEAQQPSSGRSQPPALQFIRAMMPQIVLERRISFVVLLRRLLLFVQVALWLGGVIGILYQFPATRAEALWLLDIPVEVLSIWLVVAVANKLTDLAIDNTLQTWVEQESLRPTASQRFFLRAPTLAAALKGMTSFIAGLIGIIWFLALRSFPLDSLLTGAGIFGVALTIVFQNLIKDLINGILVLWEDQFAVGDVIDVGYGAGFVEYMNLRVTKLRGEGGRLSTIPNSQINVVHNLTKEWSRIDFRIRVSQDSDPLEAIQVMRHTMEELQADPDWTERILEPTVLVGVEAIDERGTEILMWTKTKPIEQWNVAREYRRRLKQAFDEAGIAIAIPKQSIWMYEGNREEGDRLQPPTHSHSLS